MGSFTFWAVIMWHNGNATAHTNITKHNTAQHSAEDFLSNLCIPKKMIANKFSSTLRRRQIFMNWHRLMRKKAKTNEKKIENTAII